MAKVRFNYQPEGAAEPEVITAVAGDFIKENRAIEKEGLSVAEMTLAEYHLRVLFRALMRLGKVAPGSEFETWMDQVEDYERLAGDPEDAEGEEKATPAA